MINLAHTKKIELEGGCNTSDEVLLKQVLENIQRGLPQVHPHSVNPNTALLVCGGPSLAMTEKELVRSYWQGGKVIAVNGAYQWCIDHNIKPSAAVILDARESNYKFLETNLDGCRYLLASQCHARVFETCQGRDTWIWHACSGGDDELEVLQEYYFGHTFPVTLGTTVGVRSISLLRMLGFVNIEIFGLDSCFLDGKGHSYVQKENDKDAPIPVWLRPEGHDELAQKFYCAPWMIKQAEDFLALIAERSEMFQLNIHGPGLIAHILRAGASVVLEPVLS